MVVRSKLCGSVPRFVITNWMQPAGTVACEKSNLYSNMPTWTVMVGLEQANPPPPVVVVVVVAVVAVVAVVVATVVVVATLVVPPPPPPPPPPPVTVSLPVIARRPPVQVHVNLPAVRKVIRATLVWWGVTFVRFPATTKVWLLRPLFLILK